MHTADIRTVKTIMLYVGIAAAAVAVWMTFSYGRTMTFAHGIAMGLLTLVAAFIWTAADHYRKAGMKTAGTCLMALGAVFTSVEYFSHIGYTVGHRVEVSEETGVQNANWTGAQEAVVEEKTNLDLWRKQLADLKDQNAWTASVTADGLRASLASADKAIELETKRGGCKSKCLNLMQKKADLESRIATTEQVADLSKRIEATQRIIDGKRATATKTEFRSSPIVNQTKFAAQLVTMDIAPSAEAMNWTQIVIGAMIAFVTTFLAPACFFIVFGDAKHAPAEDRLAGFIARKAEPVRNTAPAPVASHSINISDERAMAQLRAVLAEMKQAVQPALRAA